MGRKQLNHVQYKRRINPEFVYEMDKTLNKLKLSHVTKEKHENNTNQHRG